MTTTGSRGSPCQTDNRLRARAVPARPLPFSRGGCQPRSSGPGTRTRLLAQALRDCREAGQTFALVAVILDALNDDAKAFYDRFAELPGHPYRLFLSFAQLDTMWTAR